MARDFFWHRTVLQIYTIIFFSQSIYRTYFYVLYTSFDVIASDLYLAYLVLKEIYVCFVVQVGLNS